MRKPHAWLLAALLLYVVTVPWPGYHYLSSGTRLLIYNLRPPVLVGIFGTTLVAIFLAKSRFVAAFVRSGFTARVIAAGLAFPLFYLGAGILKLKLSIPSLGLYVLWGLSSFLVMPLLIRNWRDIRWLATGFFLACTGNVAHSLIFGDDIATVGVAGRVSHGYANPNYYSQLIEAGLFALGLTVILSQTPKHPFWRWVRRGAIVVACVGGAYLVQQARSRNVFVGLGCLLLFYSILRFGRRAVKTLMFVLVGVCISVAAVFATMEYETLDDLSSHRLSLWEHHIDHMLAAENQALTWLIGPEEQASAAAGVDTYDEVGSQKQYTKLRADNFLLELLLEGGLLGILLFIFPYWLVIKKGFERLDDPGRRAIAWTVAYLLAVFVQGAFTPTVPTFNAPLGLSILFFGVAPIYVAYGDRSPESGVRRASDR